MAFDREMDDAFNGRLSDTGILSLNDIFAHKVKRSDSDWKDSAFKKGGSNDDSQSTNQAPKDPVQDQAG